MRTAVRAAVLAVGTCAAAVPAAAQDPYRQTVVVTAAASPVELGTVTRTLAVISREEIAALPVHSVADALRLVGAVDVRARGPRGVQTDFAVRGATFGQMLVLVDGVRLNDAQSGHHNGDIPVPLEAVERIEVLHGPGSSLFGADAFGGTVNIITRRAAAASLVVHGGSFGAAGASGQAGFARGQLAQTFAASVDRSAGFMENRDFHTTILRSRTSLGDASGLSVSLLRKEFGAHGFYGGPQSREWTNQVLVAADHRIDTAAGWTVGVDGSYRTHGDRYWHNQLSSPETASVHRTHAALGGMRASRRIGPGTLTAGADGGTERIRSNNLGNHVIARGSGFGEWRQALGTRTQVDAALRFDRYSEFGSSWSPSAGVSIQVSPLVRLRASGGRAFRVPTFTERYYSDSQHLARPDMTPERAWSGEGGIDLLPGDGWLLQATIFGRADTDVIDWQRPSADVRWQTYNIHDVDTTGVEVGVRKRFSDRAFVLAQFTALDVRAPEVTQLSKYALEYAPRSFVAAGAIPLPARLQLAPRVEYRQRHRVAARQDTVLVDARLGRRFGSLLELFVEGTNLLDETYEEIPGVRMPGAAMTVSVAIGR